MLMPIACCRLPRLKLVSLSDIFNFIKGDTPLLVSLPHSGESLGPFADTMTVAAKRIADTDWHLPRLYGFLGEMGASVLAARHSRYVIDLNRDPTGKSLYPGQNVTELCPTTTFAGDAIYREGAGPSEEEVEARVAKYWRPYHDALKAELARLVARHGYALLWETHSIASRVPRFFEGRLPDFNLGTNGGKSCGAGLGESLLASLGPESGYSGVLNGRFKGGYITRHYGNPAGGVHAVQLELSQITYMDESHPFSYHAEKADQVALPIRSMIERMLDYKPVS